MKRIYFFILTMAATTMVFSNPFLESYKTLYGSVPFDDIKTEHYLPAVKEGIKQQLNEVDIIVNNKEKPTFENTIVAFEKSGEVLNNVSAVYFNLIIADTNDEMEAISDEMTRLITDHSNNLFQHEKLFGRIKTVYDNGYEGLSVEDAELLKKTYIAFLRKGALLNKKEKKKYSELSQELSQMTLKFGQHTIKDNNAFKLRITEKEQLAGLPDYIVEAASEKAKEQQEVGWIFDLTYPSYVPFMRYAENRELRKHLYMAYNTQGAKGNEYDNKELIKNIVNKRLELVKLLGYADYAAYALENRMAENSEHVYNLLEQLLAAYKPIAEKEYQEIQHFATKQGLNDIVQSWDWSFYAEKLKEEKYGFNEQELRPYFELEQVKKGIFGLAQQLFGLRFEKTTDISVYNKEVEVLQVFDDADNFLALLYVDFHPRKGKRSGAWMTDFKEQSQGERPHVSLVMNFSRATGSDPVLLTLDEVETFAHEFGHALHSMLSRCTYKSLSGTNVYRDFVELPSQLMENWCTEKEFLDGFAFHYKTGETIPEILIEKLKRAQHFNIAYACVRQLSFGLLDMAWHTLKEPFNSDVIEFEQQAWEKARILPVVQGTCMSTNFNHLFSGGYAAGYYSYKWAEVLDADAFSVFKKQGIFDKKTADSFRKNILEKGGSEPPMVLYKRFRGQEPAIDGLLIRDGIKTKASD